MSGKATELKPKTNEQIEFRLETDKFKMTKWNEKFFEVNLDKQDLNF